MADRIHSYPMFSQNLTPNPLQQSQIPQQPPQSQQPDPQMLSVLSNPEHSRMWQQMNQLQNQYRSQQSGDMVPSQMNHQMQEFARGQALSHGQGQPMVQQMQQSFGPNAQRMNQGGPVFHDPQPSQPQPFIPSNFSNMPMNTQQQMKPALQMNPMMHAAINNPGATRQLKMLNQQEMARLQQSGLGAQHAPNQPTAVDMFASQSMPPSQEQMHSSPHPAAQSVGPPGANQQMVPGNPQQNAQKRVMTPVEFQERRNYLVHLITQAESAIQSLMHGMRNSPSMDPQVQQRLAQLRNEHAARKEVYAKFVATYGAMVTQQMLNGIPQPNLSHISPMPPSASQQPPQPSVSNPQVQPGFVTQGNQPVAAQYNVSAGNGASPLPTQNQGVLNPQIPIQPQQSGRPNIPPRSGGTPHQIPGQLPNTSSPNLGNFAGQGGQKIPNPTRQSVGIMPLDKQRFDSTYTQFCRSQNINPNLRVAMGEGRTVDLHLLHANVMHEGGAQSVTQRDMWAVIGGRLGFIQFPGNDSEPARSGPGIAQQLQNTYEQYLHHFEHAYILTVKNRPAMGGQPQPALQMNQSPLIAGNSTTPGIPGGSSEMPPNVPRQFPDQRVIAAVARYARTTPDEMRAQGVPDHLISFVERNRAELMKIYQQQVQMIAKRAAEQQQQNLANGQGSMSNIHEQASIPLQPGVQRPLPPNVNGMANIPPADSKMVNGSFAVDNVPPPPPKLLPPTQEQVQSARGTIQQLKSVFQQRLPGMATQQIPDDQRAEYARLLDLVHKMTLQLDTRLHLYFVVFKSEELLRKYVAIVLTVGRQWHLANSSTPQYIISLPTLKTVQGQIHKLNEEFENRWRAMQTAAAANQHPVSLNSGRLNPSATLTVPPSMHNTPQITPTTSSNGRQVPLNPPPPHPHSHTSPSQHIPSPRPTPSHPQPNQTHPYSQPPLQPPPPPIKKPFHPPSPSNPPPSTIASPTPPPAIGSSSTPATSAPTPQTAIGSPQTPKSPPSRATAKKSVARATRKPSTPGKAPATPETIPSAVAGIKRPPEDDVTTLTTVAPSEAEASNAPSPKKIKMEWDNGSNEALVQRHQEAENIKSEEEAAAFFDRMKALFDMSATTDNDISHDIASTLDQILAGVAQEPADAAATAAALSVHGDAGPPPTALSPHTGPANDAFLEFIDFSLFTTLDDEDNDSKAPTPDLVSETNPSPESGSEGDLSGSPDKAKIEETDPLRLGSLREIDGGESAYYQVDNWKWEGQMPTLDQPWAIFTS